MYSATESDFFSVPFLFDFFFGGVVGLVSLTAMKS